MRGTEQEAGLVIQAQCGDCDAMEQVLRSVKLPLRVTLFAGRSNSCRWCSARRPTCDCEQANLARGATSVPRVGVPHCRPRGFRSWRVQKLGSSHSDCDIPMNRPGLCVELGPLARLCSVGGCALVSPCYGKLRLAAWLGAFAGARPLALRLFHRWSHDALLLQVRRQRTSKSLRFRDSVALLECLQRRIQLVGDVKRVPPLRGSCARIIGASCPVHQWMNIAARLSSGRLNTCRACCVTRGAISSPVICSVCFPVTDPSFRPASLTKAFGVRRRPWNSPKHSYRIPTLSRTW